MQSPILSRTPSAGSFAPGPHRRSHPNLQNLSTLSLAPLTPKYPIDPADYNAYFDPSTSELHTSASLSHIAALPSPDGILTKSPACSREPSRTRKQRKTKSHVHIREPKHEQLRESATQSDVASIADRKPQLPKPSSSQLRLTRIKPDPSWLVQTGLSLTESSREVKGQSWISKRDSSTSLATTPVDYFNPIDRPREGRTPRSGRATPARSRVSSRNPSCSRTATMTSHLKMTTSVPTSPIAERGSGVKSASFVTAAELELDDQIREEDEGEDQENILPNWADAKTQAELAAQLQEEMEDTWLDDGDPYGMLNFENQGSESDGDSQDDEEEVRRALSRYRLGGWMGLGLGLDGAIDALLRVEQVHDPAMIDVEKGTDELESWSSNGDGEGDVETPPPTNQPELSGPGSGPGSTASVWVDANWLARLFRRSAST